MVKMWEQTKRWFTVTPDNRRYEQILGRKISNVSLYAYMMKMDQMNAIMQEMQLKIEK
jgi:hypothetical protein